MDGGAALHVAERVPRQGEPALVARRVGVRTRELHQDTAALEQVVRFLQVPASFLNRWNLKEPGRNLQEPVTLRVCRYRRSTSQPVAERAARGVRRALPSAAGRARR